MLGGAACALQCGLSTFNDCYTFFYIFRLSSFGLCAAALRSLARWFQSRFGLLHKLSSKLRAHLAKQVSVLRWVVDGMW